MCVIGLAGKQQVLIQKLLIGNLFILIVLWPLNKFVKTADIEIDPRCPGSA